MFKKIFNKKNRSRLSSYTIVIVAYIVLQLLVSTGGISSRFKSLLVPTTCYIVVAIALNMVVGFSGELSLGHAGFMCVGAFAGSTFTMLTKDAITVDLVRFTLAIIIGAAFAAISGFLFLNDSLSGRELLGCIIIYFSLNSYFIHLTSAWVNAY